ncbi:hypothetical protein LP419_06540 [Massilia sp. H-1]|nr:hypothetical protein LP419_06540 [Massilia sp. H-1]
MTDALPTDAIFAPTSFWYTPIPASVPLHPNTTGFVAEFLRQKAAYYGTVNINTWSYASPVYTAQADTPPLRVAYSIARTRFTVVGAGSAVDQRPHAFHGCASRWLGCRNDRASAIDGFAVGILGHQEECGRTMAGMLGRQDEQRQHQQWHLAFPLRHDRDRPALRGRTNHGGRTEPRRDPPRDRDLAGRGGSGRTAVVVGRNRSDGLNPLGVPNRIPQGLRFRLDPTIQVDSLPMTAVSKTIAKAAQKYGFVVWDKAGAISLRAQNPKTYTAMGQVNPYPTLFWGKPSYAVLDGFPWDKLQFLPMDYGKP